MNIFKTLFGGRDNSTDNKQKEEKNFEILKYDGVRALKTSQVDYAIQCFTHALEMNDADLECRDYLSRAYIMTGDLPQAYEQLRIMSEACPDNVAILVRIADVAYMMENYTMMADACEKALLVDAANPQVNYLYAKACQGQGELNNAVALLTKALALNADFDQARQLRGEILLENGDYEDAAEDVANLLQRFDSNEDVLLLNARVQKAQGNHDAAIQMYSKVIEVNPFCVEAFKERGTEYRKQGDEQAAQADEATAAEYEANMPNADEGIEEKIKKAYREKDPYGVF